MIKSTHTGATIPTHLLITIIHIISLLSKYIHLTALLSIPVPYHVCAHEVHDLFRGKYVEQPVASQQQELVLVSQCQYLMMMPVAMVVKIMVVAITRKGWWVWFSFKDW